MSWESTTQHAFTFLRVIPRKQRVQKYGFYYGNKHFFKADDFDDIKEGLENGLLSEETCVLICKWNKRVGRENWTMKDVRQFLYPAFGRHIERNFLYSHIKELFDLGLMECVNPEVETGRLFRLTEKGERIISS